MVRRRMSAQLFYRAGMNVGPTVRTLRLAASGSIGASSVADDCAGAVPGVVAVVALARGLTGLPSAPTRG